MAGSGGHALPSIDESTIQDLLNNGFRRLTFPQPLEAEFRNAHTAQAIATLQKNVPWIYAVFILLGVGIWLLIPRGSQGFWPLVHSLIGAVILLAGAFTNIRAMDRWYLHYCATIAFAGLALTLISPIYYLDPNLQRISLVGSLYAVIIVYTVLGLRFVAACIACWSAGALTLIYISISEFEMDWLTFHQTFTAANIVGMMIAYLTEHRNRTLFLQSRLLQLKKDKNEQLAHTMEKMSQEDALTGLANRRYFDAVYEREWKRAQRAGISMAVMFIDIDHFKAYNDNYGHQQGDDCISTIGRIIGSQAKRPCDLAARYGGEEFVVIYPHTGEDGLQPIAERTLKAVREAALPHQYGTTADIITVSIGLSCCIPKQGIAMDQLLKQADKGLYQAKLSGRNQWVFSPMTAQPDALV